VDQQHDRAGHARELAGDRAERHAYRTGSANVPTPTLSSDAPALADPKIGPITNQTGR